MNGCGKNAQSGEKQCEGGLQEQREEGDNFEDPPPLEARVAKMPYAQLRSGSDIFPSQILAQPLLNEDAYGRCDKAEDQACEPHNIHLYGGRRRRKRSVSRGSCIVSSRLAKSNTCLQRNLSEKLHADGSRVLLKRFVRLDDEGGHDSREQTGLDECLLSKGEVFQPDETHKYEKSVDILLAVLDFIFVDASNKFGQCRPAGRVLTMVRGLLSLKL